MWCKDPPWFNTNIKSLIREKIKTYKVHRKNIENNQQIEKLKSLQNRLKWMIDDSKHNYHSKFANKFLNVQRNSKPYWSILKTFSNNKKIPIIPLYFIKMNSSLILKRKLNYLIHFFAKQCSLISNDRKIPSRLHYIAEKFLSTIKFPSNNIFDIIQKLDLNKKHPWSMNIRMLTICGKPICRPLDLIFNECISNCFFPSEWKKVNVVPIHEKNDKRCL